MRDATALLDTQRLFAGAIREVQAGDAATRFLHTLAGAADQRHAGLAAYRRNALLNACKAIVNTYPVLAQVVGEEFLHALARDHWQATPSCSGDLNEYGADLAASLAGPAEQAGMPWLVDLARLEWAVHAASMAADPAPLALDSLQALPADRLPGLRLTLQAACRLIRSDWPIASLWQQHQPDHMGALDLDTRGAETALVLRQGWQLTVIALDAPQAAFWSAAQAGRPLTAMIDEALEHAPHFDPAECLRQGFAQGLITALH